MKIKNSISLIVIAIVALVANVSVNAAPPLSTIQKAKAVVEDARYQLPLEAGYGLVLTHNKLQQQQLLSRLSLSLHRACNQADDQCH